MASPIKYEPWASLTAQREAQGLTKAALASRAGIHPTHVSSLENGRIRPRIESVRKLATALGVPIGAIPLPGKTEGSALTEERIRAIIAEMLASHVGSTEDQIEEEPQDGSDPDLVRVSKNMSSRAFSRAVRALRGTEHDFEEMASFADMLDNAAATLRAAVARAGAASQQDSSPSAG